MRARGSSIVVGAALALVLGGALCSRVARAERYAAFPRGKVFVPQKLFEGKDQELDQVVLAANPRVYLYPDFSKEAEHILVIGMPGWGGRSENFIWSMINGLKRQELTSRLILAAIQDLYTGGPHYQGQGDRDHANVWEMDKESIKAMRHFILGLVRQFGRLQVYLMGFSSGAVAAPRVAIQLGRWSGSEPYSVGGAISVGTGSGISASALKAQQQRLLLLVVPERRSEDPEPMRDDQGNRKVAELTHLRLTAAGAASYLRTIESARRHVDWHWGLLSPCRYFPTSRIDPGRGYYPNYWMPNPETYNAISPFIQGRPPPEDLNGHEPIPCPH